MVELPVGYDDPNNFASRTRSNPRRPPTGAEGLISAGKPD
jgi:hypothetical protein